ncbi:T9SS type B sorting domain-containing protein [Gramella jeungdoensis]|uniref:T9SS type B sorting domain-containing protein n=1 Tax=Gramella jeungdoensis TaxID=708091 RepID=A0ABT0YYP5_9FLAO|nr:T9SS type B sorting domain-containing protein [Gramella jeungdoensis]MCM8568155.1 T9SS type B sorting domain-containing protein [Gramella jeungdoensis]
MRISLVIFLFLFSLPCISQSNANDCSGAIQICGNGAISSNADGMGRQEISNLNSCSSQEHNSLWLFIKITKEGTLGFTLKPTSSDIMIDYDFFIYGPNSSCGDLGYAVRCSTTNPNAAGLTSNQTGMRDNESDTSEGPGPHGNSYVKSLDVLPGETYFIVIDRPIGNSPFELKWTGTATVGGFPFPEGPEIMEPNDLQTCNSNITADFDLSVQNSDITNQSNTTLTYHESLEDASDNLNPIDGTYTSNQSIKTIYARVENDLTGCAKITDFDLIINEGPLIQSNYTWEKCDLDYSGNQNFHLDDINTDILNGLSSAQYQIEYFENSSDAIANLNPLPSTYISEGDQLYARVWENGNPDCFNISEIELILNTPPQIQSISINQPTINSNTNTVTLNVEAGANYEYSIGSIDGPYQTSTTFQEVESGFQTLYIRDLEGCAILEAEIAILGYDNFFTPNGDGINDYWQIKGILADTARENLISVFDRYGKLLYKMDALEQGWDGTFKGKEMPADDYWFRVLLQNGQEFNGHFSLIR